MTDIYDMNRKKHKIYSRYTQLAIELLAKSIRQARTQKKMTAQDLSERIGISRDMLHRIEKGEPGCAIGAVFEAAAILGLHLFDSDQASLKAKLSIVDDKLTLLPKSVRKQKVALDDDF